MKKVAVLFIVALLLVACGGESNITPETITIKETVISEIPVTIEVTRIVEREIVREIEVTREVEVDVIREIEVTRIVEIIPMPTDTPSPTNTPTPTSGTSNVPAPPLTSVMLQTMIETRTQVQSYGGIIDSAVNSGVIHCQQTVDLYDSIANSRSYDVSRADDTVKSAYTAYRRSVDIFRNGDGIVSMTNNCRNFLVDEQPGNVPFQQWGVARTEVNQVLEVLHPAIKSLGGE